MPCFHLVAFVSGEVRYGNQVARAGLIAGLRTDAAGKQIVTD